MYVQVGPARRPLRHSADDRAPAGSVEGDSLVNESRLVSRQDVGMPAEADGHDLGPGPFLMDVPG